MKRLLEIFILILTSLSADSLDTDVNHVIVDHKGNSIIAIIDSIDLDRVYYKIKNDSGKSAMDIDKVYFIYNDYDRIYHYDWSYYENLRRITNRAGQIITLDNDSILFKNIEFSTNRIFPEILVHGANDTSFYMPALDVYKIQTDYSVMHYAAERGFWYSFSSFILSAALETRLKWDKGRRLSPQVWDQYNDLLPALNIIGAKNTGVTYASVSYLIPLSVVGSMLWDIWKDKRSFYFHPLEKNKPYPRTMYVFSPKHIVESFIHKTMVRVERSKIGKYIFTYIRKKYN
tara:strand:+ start:864 stop:1727 length:864 start_codon:yes stop_codon:yes gene_type:complete